MNGGHQRDLELALPLVPVGVGEGPVGGAPTGLAHARVVDEDVEPPELADAIVEVTETGSSLRAHSLRILDTVLESNTQLIANTASWQEPRKRAKIRNLALMLRGALEARGRVGLMLNVRRDDLDGVLAVLPALNKPTVAALSDAAWVAVNTVIEEARAWEILPQLKAAKAEGIVEYPLNKVVG